MQADERSNTVLKTYNKDNTSGWTITCSTQLKIQLKKNRGLHILH